MVRFNNYTKFIDKRGARPYYKWKVFVDEPESILVQIERVEYTLHPTFPEPHQVRGDPADKFALETSGWGEFTMLVEVKFHDGRVETIPYWLDFHKGWPEEIPAV